ncbi:MAG: alpha/beta fold hydrolase [Bacteroidia bacterium]|nr:alpha/beta fold hydrolase [Bacteroidia bacterium]
MPLIESNFRGNKFIRNGHLETMLPALFRKVKSTYSRFRLELEDGDFMDLDCIHQPKPDAPILVLFHGLEGSSQSQYMLGFSRMFSQLNYRIVAVNFRSCSGEMNRLIRSYNAGVTEDIHRVMQWIRSHYEDASVYALGFSLGGNALLKYACDGNYVLPENLVKVAAVSSPVDLAAGAKKLEQVQNRIYLQRFLNSLNKKILYKANQFPGEINTKGINQLKTFTEWDSRFTAPLHGYRDANDYYLQCSALQFLGQAFIPTLLLNAQNDPFLAPECFPYEIAKGSSRFYFEAPQAGGHVGFAMQGIQGAYYSEQRILEFFKSSGPFA